VKPSKEQREQSMADAVAFAWSGGTEKPVPYGLAYESLAATTASRRRYRLAKRSEGKR